jgi:heme-degrading monooxygenase HmoA
MIAVIFELWPADDQEATYFELAAGLRSELELIDRFVSIERFESLATKGKYLSLSFWRDEAAVAAWRNHHKHRDAQGLGRGVSGDGDLAEGDRAGRQGGVLANYRLRVAQVKRDYGLHERSQAPQDSRKHHGGMAP